MNIMPNPQTWQDLQQYSADLLSDCGFTSIVEKIISTARGNVNVDVYATISNGFDIRIACECKYWNTPVPQTIIHAFRTVVNDAGISHGYIISKSGFQKGSYAAIENSNISILSWAEFQDKFAFEWLEQVVRRNSTMGKNLQAFGRYLIENGVNEWPTIYPFREDAFLQLRDAYSDFIFWSFTEHYRELLSYKISFTELDQRIRNFQREIPIAITCYKEFFDYIYKSCSDGIRDVETIFEHKILWKEIAGQ